MKCEKVVIIGAGPAGIACAIQLKRSGIEPFLIERDEVGGLLLQAHLVENYPGFPSGISGEKLVERFVAQLERFAIHAHQANVMNISRCGEGYAIRTESGEMRGEIAVVAAGTVPRHFVPAHIRLNGTVHYDIRRLRLLRAQRIAIIGGGDAAFDYALALSKMNRVEIFFRKNEPSCLPLLHERAMKKDSIQLHGNCTIDDIKKAEGGVVLCHQERETGDVFDHILCATGRVANTDMLSSELVAALEQERFPPHLYFIGDIWRGSRRQAAIAIGDGVRTAMEIAEREKHEGVSENQ